MEKQLMSEFEKTGKDLLDTISSFSDEQFNIVPFEGSWTAAQVCDHLLKGNSGVPELFNGKSKPSGRNPLEKEPQISSVFLDFETKFKSPDFTLPSKGHIDRSEILNSHSKTIEALRLSINSHDLSLLYTDFPFPGMGEFTGYEWIHFVTSHTKRHTRQMKNILKILQKKNMINS